MDSITLIKPDDWHCHLRDGAALVRTVGDQAARFTRTIVMPNLAEPVTDVAKALAYKARIMAQVPAGIDFTPLMTLYLTDRTTPAMIDAAADAGIVACKLYPAGATTNAASGVTDVSGLAPVFERMAEHGILLLCHGEVTDAHVDVFDREAVFIEHVLIPLLQAFPSLKVVLEHVTTAMGVDCIKANDQLAGTLTPQHLLFNRNALFKGGLCPDYYCLPILKTETDREALVAAAVSGHPRFFLGTDSAPHSQASKYNACGCAGVYSAHAGIELYAMLFDAMGAIDKLEGFASQHGASFYGLPANTETITLERRAWVVPATYSFGEAEITPLLAGESVTWQIQ